jgi:DNA polymerase III subunit delta
MPARLKPAAARAQIASGALEPLYLLVGDDEAEKTALVAAFSDSVDAELRAFNVDRLYGAETSVSAFCDAVRTLPLLAPRRLVIVVHADRLFVPKRESAASQQDLEALEDFVKAPEAHATVVFVADAIDGRRTLSKLLFKHAVVVECGGVADAVEAEHWIRARVAERGMGIEPAAVRLLVERAGLSVPRLRAEIERVCLFATGRPAVSAADVREVAGAATSQDDWAMVNAMRDGNAALALRELSLLLDGGGMPLQILGQLRSFVERAHLGGVDRTGRRVSQRPPITPDQQKRAFEALLRTDLALKTSAGDPQILLERLLVELCVGM